MMNKFRSKVLIYPAYLKTVPTLKVINEAKEDCSLIKLSSETPGKVYTL